MSPSSRSARRALLLLIGATALAASATIAAPAGPAVTHLRLTDPALLATEETRQRAQYLVSCALPEGVVVDAEAAGQHYEFPGSLGLAPAWSRRALTPDESRRVSACMLARTNYFGRRVEISMRGLPVLMADADEGKRFPLYEGGFFGNLFSDNAPGYACTGASVPDRDETLRANLRLCAVADGRHLPDGRPLSWCGFIVVGSCVSRPFVQDGVDYSQNVVHVYLEGRSP